MNGKMDPDEYASRIDRRIVAEKGSLGRTGFQALAGATITNPPSHSIRPTRTQQVTANAEAMIETQKPMLHEVVVRWPTGRPSFR